MKALLTISAHLVAVLAAAGVFAFSLQASQPVSYTSLAIAMLVSCSAAAVVCVGLTALLIKLLPGQGCAPVPSISGLAATHIPLTALTFGLSALLVGPLETPTSSATWLCGLFLAAGSCLALRVWVFLTPVVEQVEYEVLPGDFYENTTEAEEVGGFRAWYHGGRYSELLACVSRFYKPGDRVYDFGCGGAEWNRAHLPVVGVDVNRSLLEAGKAKGQLSEIVVSELHSTGLPECSADLIIISEVIEHIADPSAVLKEIRRCLKPGGTLILTVPWDTPFSPFFWLFNVQCFYRGYLLGEPYYRQRCGHINHFSGRSLRRLLVQSSLGVLSLYRFRGFLLYSFSQKPPS